MVPLFSYYPPIERRCGKPEKRGKTTGHQYLYHKHFGQIIQLRLTLLLDLTGVNQMLPAAIR